MSEKPKSQTVRFLILLGCSAFFMFVSFFLLLSGQFLGAAIRELFTKLLIPDHALQTDLYATYRMYMSFIGIWIICPAVLLIFPKNRHILKNLGRGMKGNNLKMLLLGMGMGLAANLVCCFAAILNGDIQPRFDSLQPIPLLLAFVIMFIQSSSEELVCRGYLYHKILSVGGKPLSACILSSIFFSYIHLGSSDITPLAAVNLFLLGVMCAAMVIYADSIWAAMGFHTAWNFCMNHLLGLPNSGNVVPLSVFKVDPATATDSFANSVIFGPEGTIVASVVLILSIVLVWLWYRRCGCAKAASQTSC